jgi:hypothetical protein
VPGARDERWVTPAPQRSGQTGSEENLLIALLACAFSTRNHCPATRPLGRTVIEDFFSDL